MQANSDGLNTVGGNYDYVINRRKSTAPDYRRLFGAGHFSACCSCQIMEQ